MTALAPRNIVADAALPSASMSHYLRNGWTHVPGFFTALQMASISTCVERLTLLPEVRGRHMVYREASLLNPQVRVIQRIEDFCRHDAELDTWIRGGHLWSAVECLFDAPVVLFKDKINLKLAGGGGFEPHQDQAAGWSRYAPLFITAMITLDAATLENGCLEIGSGPRLHRLLGPEWQPLGAEALKGAELKPVPTAPGDAVFFDSYVPHASKPNLTQTSRRVLYLTYNRASDGDHRERYYADKRAAFPPDIERIPGVEYRYRV
jgi:2-aminoethylphosphonate dioxygenase